MTTLTTVTMDSNTSVPGLYYHPNVIPVEAQEELIKFFESIKDADSANTNTNTSLVASWERAGIASRKVLHFGYQYPYNRALKLTPTHEIPEIIKRLLINPLQTVDGVQTKDKVPWVPDQVIINRYFHKEGIGAHTDHKKLFKDKIVCVTIGESADMLFKHVELNNATIKTESGSVYIMTGKARWEFTHEMIPNKFIKPRYSITFRNVERKYVVASAAISSISSSAPSVTSSSAPSTVSLTPSVAPPTVSSVTLSVVSGTPSIVSVTPSVVPVTPPVAAVTSRKPLKPPTVLPQKRRVFKQKTFDLDLPQK